MSSPTAYEFALSPKASEDDASAPGTASTLAFPTGSPSPPSPLYLSERTQHHDADLERAMRRATLIERQFGMSYPCDFGDCTDVLPSARALACHLHIHYIAMELPEERGLALPSFYCSDDFMLTKSPGTPPQRAVAAARAMMDFALKLWAALVWFFWR